MNNREDRPEVKMAELAKRISAVESELENALETLTRFTANQKNVEDQNHELTLTLRILEKKILEIQKKLKIDQTDNRKIEKELFGV